MTTRMHDRALVTLRRVARTMAYDWDGEDLAGRYVVAVETRSLLIGWLRAGRELGFAEPREEAAAYELIRRYVRVLREVERERRYELRLGAR